MPRQVCALIEAGEVQADLKAIMEKQAKERAEKEKAEQEANQSASDSDKIMGIPKTGFYIGLGVLVILGGYFGYKKFIAKGK